MKVRLLFIFYLFSIVGLSAQDKASSGLAKWQDESLPSFERIYGYTDYIWAKLMFSNPDSAYVLLKEVEAFAQQEEEIQGLAYVYNQIGVSHGIRGNLSEASEHFRLSTENLLEVGDFEMYISVMENLAHSYEQGGLLSKSLAVLKESERFADLQGIPYKKDYANEVYGTIYLRLGKLQAAKQRFYTALDLYEPDSISIGTNYKYLGDVYQKENKIDSALYFYQKSLDIHNLLSKSNACQTALSMGKLFFEKGAIATANVYMNLTMTIAESLSLKDELTGAYILQGQIRRQENQLSQAIQSYEQALEIAKKGNHLINQEKINRELYELYKRQANSSKALAYLEASKILGDRIQGNEVKKQLQLLDFRNQVLQDSIQRENVIQTNQLKYESSLRSRNYVVLLLLGIALSLLAFAYFLFRAKREKENLLAEVQEQHKKVSQMNEEIIRTKDELIIQEKLASLGQLTAGIAHEIKNPLNFITNFSEDSSELIEELDQSIKELKSSFPPEKNQFIQSNLKDLQLNIADIQTNGFRIDQIVNNMMNHARESEQVVVLEAINPLVEINVNFAYKGFKAINRTYRVEIIKDFDPNLSPLKIYPQELGRVILNLVNNACYATHQKKQSQAEYQPKIEIRTAKENEQLKIEIEDNGVGISKDTLQNIFNPFFTTKPTGEGNIGLGLSISYDIITKLHQGQLKVSSVEGRQTIFTILLPYT